jgi:hypothetical protein
VAVKVADWPGINVVEPAAVHGPAGVANDTHPIADNGPPPPAVNTSEIVTPVNVVFPLSDATNV